MINKSQKDVIRLEVQFPDTQALYDLQDTLQSASATLQGNVAVVEALMRDLTGGNRTNDLAQSLLGPNLFELRTQSKRVDSMLVRADTLSRLVCLRCFEWFILTTPDEQHAVFPNAHCIARQ